MAYKQVILGAAVAAFTFSLAACGGEAATEGASEAVAATTAAPAEIEERQATFKSLGKSFKAIRTQLESGSPDTAAILVSATEMNAAAVKVGGLFPDGSSVDAGYDTEALAAIWEKPDEFAAAHQRLVDATAEMMTIAEGGDVAAIGDQVGAVGGSCKNCHDNFRLDTD
ncbi:MAG: cytochrome c [Pseudomonadota bacterium]